MSDAEVLVVGGGLSGLALASALVEKGRPVKLLEAAPQLGGNLRTRRVANESGEWLLELGPNSFGETAEPLLALARRAGIGDRVVRADERATSKFLWRAGRLREVPSNPVKFIASGLLPARGVLRMLKEPWVPPRPAGLPEESLADFCDRRLGRLAREKLLTAVVGGIYAGDPAELGVRSSFPAMAALEEEHGSLFRAARRGKGPPSRGRLCSFAGGLEELPAALRSHLGDVAETNAPVAGIAREAGMWRAETADGRAFSARALALTSPSPRTAELVRPLDAALAAELAAIPYAPMAVVHVGAARASLPGLRPGFGFLVPRNEGLRVLGAIFSSELFEGRAPRGHALLTVFCGGRLDPDAPSLDDAAIRAFVLADLRRALGLAAEPSLFEVTRWPRAIPQYVVGHAERLARIDAALASLPGLRLLGNWRGGVAMPDCVRNAELAAATI